MQSNSSKSEKLFQPWILRIISIEIAASNPEIKLIIMAQYIEKVTQKS
jgi:hypothetical protein